MPNFERGRQPCQTFTPADELFPGSGNVHCCEWPFEKTPRCHDVSGGLVSYCTACNSDHHSDGYETCAAEKKP